MTDPRDAILWARNRRPFHHLWRDPAPELQGTSRADTTTSQKDKTT